MTTLTEATNAEIEAELVSRKLTDSESTRDNIQAVIDADAKLAAAGITTTADPVDELWVRLTFPADADGVPAFWGSIAGQVIEAGGEAVETGVVRTSKGRALTHLATVSALLPDAEE